MTFRRSVFVRQSNHSNWQHRQTLGVWTSKPQATLETSNRGGFVQRRDYVFINNQWFRVNVMPEQDPLILEQLRNFEAAGLLYNKKHKPDDTAGAPPDEDWIKD